MGARQLYEVEWRRDGDLLTAIEPTAAELRAAAAPLAAFYNDGHNSQMLAHEEALSPADVTAHYRRLRAQRGHPFLLQRNGGLAGDGDLRNVVPPTGELAILIGARSEQGRGLGTRFAIMLHAFAFRTLGLERVLISIIPANVGSRRLFEKLGYTPDDSPAARAIADEATDLTLSLARPTFEARYVSEISEIILRVRASVA
jgi:RimJ/RimL family protein N-acetyltransferase